MNIPKKIINEVAQKMLDNKIVFEDIAIVPNVFLIYLHTADYAEIRFLIKTLREQVIVRLNKEIAKTEKKGKNNVGKIKSLVNFLAGIEVLGGNHKIIVPNDWSVSFEPTAKIVLVGDEVFEIAKGEICVVANYTEQNARSVKLDSLFKTQVTIFRSQAEKSENYTVDSIHPTAFNPFKTNVVSDNPKSVFKSDVSAVLTVQYNGEKSKETFEITKEKITIGRDPKCEVVLLKASDRISRKHLEINLKEGKFLLKSFGVYGTTVDGQPVPLSEKIVENVTQELNTEVLLGQNARIALAGGEVLLDFTKAVK
jgi:hypothetical protein